MFIRNNKVLTIHHKWLKPASGFDPYNPLNLPPYTIRVKYKPGTEPYILFIPATKTLVDAEENIWDVTTLIANWQYLFDFNNNNTNLLEVLGANSRGVVNMRGTFIGCTSLTSVPLFDTSSVTTMDSMFLSCISLTSVPEFDTRNVTNMSGMLAACKLITSVPLFNTSKVTNMTAMLHYTSITEVPLFDTSNVTTMESMLLHCKSLETVPLFDTSNVTNMESMLSHCKSLETVPLFDTSNVTNMQTMLGYCSNLKYIPLFNTSKVTNMESICENCYNVESGALALYQQASTQTNPPQQYRWAFLDCGSNTQSGADELAQIPTDWGGTMSIGGGIEIEP